MFDVRPEQVQTDDRRMIFYVEGRAAPQGSKTKQRGGFRESSKYLPVWRKQVAAATSYFVDGLAMFDAIDVAVRVETHFYIARPKKTAAPYPVAPSIGDGDKLTRAVWDGLVKGGLLSDDRFVCKWEGSKQWADTDTPGCLVILEVIRD